MQSKYDFAKAKQKFGDKIQKEVAHIPTPLRICHEKKHIAYTENEEGFIEETKSIHPGIILKKKFLETSGLSPCALGMKINVPSQRLYDIINCKRSITPNLALRLAFYFRTSKYFWFELQSKYDFAKAKQKFGDKIQKEVAPGPRKSTEQDFLKIEQKALQVFESQKAMKEWFTSKIKSLGGRTPLDLKGTKKGIKIILEELKRLHIN
ncbi:MAG: hypothetical protein BWX99_02904 [Deltaproteobacteria bacterium ADurb.Bin151]|nr:MAG: hypothetical protein BWX99_02904 [Deltaproteobacteria bacterium ADurb.Bin151]